MRLLQEQGYLYHIDDLGRDEPFVEQVNRKDFVVVLYTLRNSDSLRVEGHKCSSTPFLGQTQLDFDQSYEGESKRRRMFSLSAYDHISGSPQNGARPGKVPPLREKPSLCTFRAQG